VILYQNANRIDEREATDMRWEMLSACGTHWRDWSCLTMHSFYLIGSAMFQYIGASLDHESKAEDSLFFVFSKF
jgi:hypothetical protein